MRKGGANINIYQLAYITKPTKHLTGLCKYQI